MNNTNSFKPSVCVEDDMQEEYSFDYDNAKPNRFVGALGQDRLMVCLDADVAAVFKSADSVNHVLRAIITSLPAAKIECS